MERAERAQEAAAGGGRRGRRSGSESLEGRAIQSAIAQPKKFELEAKDAWGCEHACAGHAEWVTAELEVAQLRAMSKQPAQCVRIWRS